MFSDDSDGGILLYLFLHDVNNELTLSLSVPRIED